MENHLENIDAYFSGSLSAEEKKDFERKIAEDKNFAEQVAFYLSAFEAAKEEMVSEKKEWFKQLATQNTSQAPVRHISSVRTMVYRLAAAASIVGIIFLAWSLFFQKSISPDRLADNYINSKLATIGTTMGTGDSIQFAIDLYNKGQLNLAAQKFEEFIQRDSSDTNAKQYAGMAYLRLNNFEKALNYFEQLEKYSLLSNPAVFYQAVTLMKRNAAGDKEKAKQLLIEVTKSDSDPETKKLAQQWLDKL